MQLSDRVNVSQAHRVTKHRPGDDSEMDGNIVEKVKERRVEWGAKNIRTERERKQKSHHHSWLSCTTPRKEEEKKMRTAGRPSLATLEKRNRDDGRDGEKEEEEDETRELIEREIVGVILFI